MSIQPFPKARFEAGARDFGHGCYAYLQPDGSWGLSNAGLVTDSGEALLVDTLFDAPHTRVMLDSLRRATTAKIRTLVNTHQNGDHWFGNALVEDAETIATERAASAMAHEPPSLLAGFMKAAPGLGVTGEYLVHCFGRFDFADTACRLPDTTFTGRLTKQVGAKKVEIIEVGPAHTGGDAIVHVPADRAVFTGDILFIEGHPIIWAGPVGNWIEACEMILGLDAEIIVPGHGPVTDKHGIMRVRDYLEHRTLM